MKRSSSLPSGAEEKSAAVEGEEVAVTIARLGAQADGIAEFSGRILYIPLTLPGEQVLVREDKGDRAELIAVQDKSSERVQPICPYFGACGGCTLQHFTPAATAQWKQNRIAEELAREKLEAPISDIKSYGLSTRRRVTVSAKKTKEGLILGFNALRSHTLIDIETCPLLVPQIVNVLPHLRQGLAAILGQHTEARIQITAAENGLDINIEGPKLASQQEQKALTSLQAPEIIRVHWNKQLLWLSSQPFIVFGDARVDLPPEAFLQAVKACEADMAAFAIEALKEAGTLKGPVCDLFSGLGAFSFPLARHAPVTPVEMVGSAIDALQKATRANQGFKPIQPLRRDLYRAALSPLELNRFGAVVMDPPREGAEAQSRALAASSVPTVVMMSCNPATFARDAALLTGGGYKLLRVAAFDQFQFSAHVELAGVFEKPKAAGSKHKKGRATARPRS